MEINKKLVGFIISTIFSVILINLGIWIIVQKEKYIGIITALIGFVFLYFSYYAPQISSHENKIKEIEEWIENKVLSKPLILTSLYFS